MTAKKSNQSFVFLLFSITNISKYIQRYFWLKFIFKGKTLCWLRGRLDESNDSKSCVQQMINSSGNKKTYNEQKTHEKFELKDKSFKKLNTRQVMDLKILAFSFAKGRLKKWNLRHLLNMSKSLRLTHTVISYVFEQQDSSKSRKMG